MEMDTSKALYILACLMLGGASEAGDRQSAMKDMSSIQQVKLFRLGIGVFKPHSMNANDLAADKKKRTMPGAFVIYVDRFSNYAEIPGKLVTRAALSAQNLEVKNESAFPKALLTEKPAIAYATTCHGRLSPLDCVLNPITELPKSKVAVNQASPADAPLAEVQQKTEPTKAEGIAQQFRPRSSTGQLFSQR